MKNKLGIVACSLFLAAGALCVAAVLPMPEFTLAANNADCMCGDIVFGSDDATNDNAYREVSSSTSTSELYSSTTVLLSSDFTLGSWSNASYNSKKSSNKKNCPIVIGGSNNGHSAGNFTINLKGYECDKVIIYAAGWKGDSAADLNVDVSSESYSVQTSGTYNFNEGYTFNFTKTNQIKIQNTNNKSAKGAKRVLISKIVFRLYKTK